MFLKLSNEWKSDIGQLSQVVVLGCRGEPVSCERERCLERHRTAEANEMLATPQTNVASTVDVRHDAGTLPLVLFIQALRADEISTIYAGWIS